MRLVPCNGGDALHEVEDAFGRAAFLGQNGLDDPPRLRLREPALARVCDRSDVGERGDRGEITTIGELLEAVGVEPGASWRIVSGVRPCSSAVRYTNGLNDEPGWRRASVARLNWLSP